MRMGDERRGQRAHLARMAARAWYCKGNERKGKGRSERWVGRFDASLDPRFQRDPKLNESLNKLDSTDMLMPTHAPLKL